MQRARCDAAPTSSLLHQWHQQLTRFTIIKPGLRPSSKLLFGDKSILQSQADGQMAHCNCSLSLVSLWQAPLTDVELHQTFAITKDSQSKEAGKRWPGRNSAIFSTCVTIHRPLKYRFVNMISSTMRTKNTKENMLIQWNKVKTRPCLHLKKSMSRFVKEA